MRIKDRIIDFRRVPASHLLPNPKNWRTHSARQSDALKGILAEVGIAGAVLARETPDGLMLIDGHLRTETLPDQEMPVLVLDVTEAEADKLLATYDPIAAMATADQPALQALLDSIETDSAALNTMLESLRVEDLAPDPALLAMKYEIIIELAGEQQQKELYDQLTNQGFTCRVVTY